MPKIGLKTVATRQRSLKLLSEYPQVTKHKAAGTRQDQILVNSEKIIATCQRLVNIKPPL